MQHKKRWSDLSRRTRVVIVAVGTVETALKVAALRDLKRRPAEQVRGSKVKWALPLALGNSAGALPIAYFIWGRRR